MNPDVVEFIMSLINFCESVLSIPESIYTFGLETCPWVLEHIEMIKVEYNIDILGMLPKFTDLLQELAEIKKMLG